MKRVQQPDSSLRLPQSPESREFLTRWTVITGLSSVASSLAFPLAGFIVAILSFSFGMRIRGARHPLPLFALLFSLVMGFLHLWVWVKILGF